MNDIQRLLTSELVASLLNVHPNDVGKELHFEPPASWLTWWNWVREEGVENGADGPAGFPWLRLGDCFNSKDGHNVHDIPEEICKLIQDIQRLQIPRQPIDIMGGYSSQRIIADERGMSPKKIHEVSRMVAYISKLIEDLRIDPKRIRIVDVGAGQGYLTRTLKSCLQVPHILALDSDQWQTRGSQIWEQRVARALRTAGNDNLSTPIFHKTIHITPDTLIPAVDDWIRETKEGTNHNDPDHVLFVALHACGSLTPDIFRACVSATCRRNSSWIMAGAVIVGCCYNLLTPTDFPLSKTLKASFTSSSPHSPPLRLPPSAFNLATQIPSQWLMSPKATASVSLSIRKVVWRALLGRELLCASAFGEATKNMLEFQPNIGVTIPSSRPKSSSVPPSRQCHKSEVPPLGTGSGSETGLGIGTSPTMRLLGRLPDSAYTTWSTFLHAAGRKLGLDLSASAARGQDLLLVRRMEVLHVLRCLMGPLVESLIILDRVHWLKEELAINEPEGAAASDNGRFRGSVHVCTPEKQGIRARVEAVNLFDQATGSGRNVAIIVVPASVSPV